MKFNVKHYTIHNIYIHKLFIESQIGDFIDLKAHLEHQLNFLDSFYGQYNWVKIIKYPCSLKLNTSISMVCLITKSTIQLIEFPDFRTSDYAKKPRKI